MLPISFRLHNSSLVTIPRVKITITTKTQTKLDNTVCAECGLFLTMFLLMP